MLVWVKQVWRCGHPVCPKRTWTQTTEVIAPRASLTERARAEICRRVGQDAASVAAVAREFGMGWRTAMTVVREVLMDNGKQFTDRFGRGGEVLFDRICRDNGITHRITEPASPALLH